MRDEVVFYLNGRRQRVSGAGAFGSLVEYLRDTCRLVGTKVGCAEGDCGACTVLVGRFGRTDGTLRYRTATSCILALWQLDATHVVTVEGLCPESHGGSGLSPIQEAMVRCHGSQCGYCTPGMVVALTGLFEAHPDPDEHTSSEGLTGNLCRCTGYLPILEACRSVDRARHCPLAAHYPDRALVEELRRLAAESLRIEADLGTVGGRRTLYRPDSAGEAVAYKSAHPRAVVVAGGTDLGVWKNTRGYDPLHLLSLAGVSEWSRIGRDGDTVSIGANVTWTALEEFAARAAPELLELTHHFASPQVRNTATFVGNIAHGSPIADAVGFLHVTGATLALVGPGGVRSVPVGAFFTGYRETVLSPDEVIARIVVPLPPRGEQVRLYKVSKRKEMDISTFRAAIRTRTAGGVIEHATLAFAGVGPRVLRLPETESFLVGRTFDEATFREAGRRARAEVEPISDLRGSRDFRLVLAENVLLNYYHDCTEESPADSRYARS